MSESQTKRTEFIKLQISAVIGSLLDYGVTIILVTVFESWYLAANVIGNIAGGTLQFILNKKWVFGNSAGKTTHQAGKFMLVFIGNIFLSAAGVYLFTSVIHLHYLVSKTLVSIILGVSYNYILKKRFVFP